jgi:hypothetical protein
MVNKKSPEWIAKKKRWDELYAQLQGNPYHMPLILAVDELATELGIMPVNE